MAPTLPRIDLCMDDLERLVDRTRQAPLTADEHATLKAAIDTLGYLAHLVEQKGTTLDGLRQLLFGATTEKTRDVLARAGVDAPRAPRDDGPDHDPGGHGRHGVAAYSGARQVPVAHAQLQHGDRCPVCPTGKVYRQRDPGVLIRLVGQAPIMATVYALEKLRCHLCGELFTADPPAGVGAEKYDATTGAMVALLKYGSGMPFHRLERLQANLEIPLPASTQWEIVAETATRLQPALAELTRQAAQGELVHNDDTPMTVLALGRPGAPDDDADLAPDRTGVFTSGIVSTGEGHRIALFLTGRRHAGENLAQVLAARAAELGPPIQMCDALTRNLPQPLAVILGNCLAHARRRFVEVTPSFPAECRHVLETLREVYRHDADARAQGLGPQDRLAWHQAHSGPLMDDLQAWLTAQIDAHGVEPNSGLGQAIAYLRHHWTPLTLFLRQPGAPLDNNICERALKRAILHRKNALFYKTLAGAHVGDLFMSLIHTCELAEANPFDYLTALQRHTDALVATPSAWMPWNYRDTLAAAALDSG
ncbi:MAG TPA: IS66 family transposase [bacterium]|nr:IS66 family transposase [bacterium]